MTLRMLAYSQEKHKMEKGVIHLGKSEKPV